MEKDEQRNSHPQREGRERGREEETEREERREGVSEDGPLHIGPITLPHKNSSSSN